MAFRVEITQMAEQDADDILAWLLSHTPVMPDCNGF
jgi:hypothetical protein